MDPVPRYNGFNYGVCVVTTWPSGGPNFGLAFDVLATVSKRIILFPTKFTRIVLIWVRLAEIP